ncbi:MAG: hypothetical protein A3D21_07060 [Nitrospirae bacterium RIFCSPHIGHO2_02_FULL_42_12]|nr:MAG: hypothetical protein A3D21_07060 [Nitrospirae bacterium RIFCSPHIGHO2_02_FULL_42_12]
MRVRIASNSCIKGPYYRIVLNPPSKVNITPGQFLMLRPATPCNSYDPLLPRPFSIHRVDQSGNIEILYKVVGRVTTILSMIVEGDEVDILGPLGNGFPVNREVVGDNILIIAGGIGAAPIIGLGETLRTNYPDRPIVIILGGRGEADLLCVEDLKKTAAEVIITTNDGSVGIKGYVTDALEEYLSRRCDPGLRTTVYACGPSPMLQKISEITGTRRNIETYFSLEANMACGIGLCMGCAVKRRDRGYYLVCKDGPVFRGDTIVL